MPKYRVNFSVYQSVVVNADDEEHAIELVENNKAGMWESDGLGDFKVEEVEKDTPTTIECDEWETRLIKEEEAVSS